METKPRQIITQGSTFNLTGIANFLPNIEPEPSDKEDSTSYLGTPIYSSLIFKAISGKDLNNLAPDVRDVVSQPLELTEILLTINQSKNIKRTALNGRNGTVKEYISDGDYSITIEGKIVSEYANVFPKQEESELNAFFSVPQSLEIASNHLSIFGITNIVINDFSFHEMEGFRNQIAFRVLAWSDTEFKIEPTDAAT